TRTAGGDEATSDQPAESDGGARPDDADAESSGLDGAQLLQEALGAQDIEEIPRQLKTSGEALTQSPFESLGGGGEPGGFDLQGLLDQAQKMQEQLESAQE